MNLLIAFLFAIMVIWRLSPDNNATTNSILNIGIVGVPVLVLLYNLARASKHWLAILVAGFVLMGIVAIAAAGTLGYAVLAPGAAVP